MATHNILLGLRAFSSGMKTEIWLRFLPETKHVSTLVILVFHVVFGVGIESYRIERHMNVSSHCPPFQNNWLGLVDPTGA